MKSVPLALSAKKCVLLPIKTQKRPHCSGSNLPEIETDDDPDDDIPLAALRLRVPFEDYASVDQDVVTSETVTDIAIVDSILDARNQEKEDSEEEDVQDPEPPAKPSIEQMQNAIDLMRTWIEMTENTADLLLGFQKIERRVAAEDFKRMFKKKQSCLSAFFPIEDCALDREIQ